MTILNEIGTYLRNNPRAQKGLNFLASGFGLGYVPLAPGTAGSLLGIPLFLGTMSLPAWQQLLLVLVFGILAIGLAENAARVAKDPDPTFVVVDEILGMWITLLFIWRRDPAAIAIGFVLFRLFDIVKFFPISVFEGFKGGKGIIFDDVAAGMLANFSLRLVLLSGLF